MFNDDSTIGKIIAVLENVGEGVKVLDMIFAIAHDDDLSKKLANLSTEQLTELLSYLSRAKGLIDSAVVEDER